MSNIPWKIAALGQMAILTEVSAPKPGNVSRLSQFSDMDFRNFLVSASFMGRSIHEAATKGILLAEGSLEPEDVELGELINKATSDTLAGLNRKNTILGTIMLYMPLAVAMSAMLRDAGVFNASELKKWLSRILESTTIADAVDLYRAFDLTKPGGSRIKTNEAWNEIHDRYDMDNPDAVRNIIDDEVTLQELLSISASIDEISREWASEFELILDEVLPHLSRNSAGLEDLEEGVVKSFVWLLSRRPDGLIVKKAGMKTAEKIRTLAEQVFTEQATKAEDLLDELDIALRREGNVLNPGTTADIVSAAIFCRLVQIQFAES
jgi:triphosphoribosyl-dephospho-CoA synthase